MARHIFRKKKKPVISPTLLKVATAILITTSTMAFSDYQATRMQSADVAEYNATSP
jgi:hypothetical protein